VEKIMRTLNLEISARFPAFFCGIRLGAALPDSSNEPSLIKMRLNIDNMESKNNIPRGFVRTYWLILCIALLVGFVSWHYIQRSQDQKLMKQMINSQNNENPKASTGIPPDSLSH
jgi:hypothetical protein